MRRLPFGPQSLTVCLGAVFAVVRLCLHGPIPMEPPPTSLLLSGLHGPLV